MPDAFPGWFWIGEQVLKALITVRILLRKESRPESNLAWLVVVFAEPFLGIPLYTLIGERPLGRLRVQRYLEAKRLLPVPDRPDLELTDDAEEIVQLVQALGAEPPLAGNRLELFSRSDGFAERLIGDIDRARFHCHLLFYIWLDDATGRAVAEALMRAAARGVACRCSFDAVGSKATLDGPLAAELRRSGVRIVAGLPAGLLRSAFQRVDLRNHRKIALIDGHIGYTGSQNLAHSSFAPKPKFSPWVDVMLRVHGPSVRDLQRMFIADWYAETGEDLSAVLGLEAAAHSDGVPLQILPSGPASDTTQLQQLSQAMAHRAERQLTMTTPYFVPDAADVGSLRTAARRGVQVRLIVPERNDSILAGLAARGHFESLLEAGVEIWLFRAGMLHAKTFTVDNTMAVVTTANFDKRSFELNFECSTLVLDHNFTERLREVQDDYARSSRRLTLDQLAGRPWYRRLVENAAGLLSPLL